MPVKQIGSTLTTQLWTPQFGEVSGGTMYSVGYTALPDASEYVVKDGVCVARAFLSAPGTWGVNTTFLTEWRMTLPVTPDLMNTDRHYIGYMNHNTYSNRGCYGVATLTADSPGYVIFEMMEKYAPTTAGNAVVLSGVNWSQYIVQFFGDYGGIEVILEYKVA